MEKLIEIIEKLESDFKNLDLNNQESKDFFKDRATIIIPTIEISKKATHNVGNIDILDNLEQRVIKIISQL